VVVVVGRSMIAIGGVVVMNSDMILDTYIHISNKKQSKSTIQ
jgi:hypothetical protein